MMLMLLMSLRLDGLTPSPVLPKPPVQVPGPPMQRAAVHGRAGHVGWVLLALVLLLLPPPIACDGGAPEDQGPEQRALTRPLSRAKIKSIGCFRAHKRTEEVRICASDVFRVSIGQQPDALVLRRAGAQAWGSKYSRQLQGSTDAIVLSTQAVVVLENDLVLTGTLTVGNLTISDGDTSALQGPQGEFGLSGEREWKHGRPKIYCRAIIIFKNQ